MSLDMVTRKMLPLSRRPPRSSDGVKMAIVGYADLHCHPMSHLGFGGPRSSGQSFFWGEPTGPLDQALRCCTPGHRGLSLPGLVESHHGYGAPTFSDWPRHDTLTHQQMYMDAIRGAFECGLRIMVASAVNTEMFGDYFDRSHPADTSDEAAIIAQINGMHHLAATCSAWMQIVTTSAEARAAIHAGKLAIVLGVEVDSILGGKARWGSDFDPANADAVVKKWWDKGVRLLNPIHLADNAIGGSAIKDDRFNLSNHYLFQKYGKTLPSPHFFDAESVTGDLDDVRFLLGADPANNLLINAYGKGYLPYLKELGKKGHANKRGLTAVGEAFLTAMMNRGMLIDVEHMSSHALDATLSIAEREQYPLVSSHTGFRKIAVKRTAGNAPLHVPGCATEAMRSESQLRRLQKLGSIVGIFGHVGRLDGLNADTSANWAKAYHYLRNVGFDKIAIGTDMNGFAQAPGPRFKSAQGGLTHVDTHDSVRALRYGQDIIPFIQKALVQSSLGTRKFDYNTAGLAHYGLLPDFTMDVALQLQAPDTLETFFQSAESFLSVWEACEA